MRDLIWTIIIIWLIYKIVDVYRGLTSKKNNISGSNAGNNQNSTHHETTTDKDIKSAVQKHLNNEGEYVDFEEIK